jgi:hypothetical protein
MKTIEYIKKYGLEGLKADLAIQITDYSDRVVLNYHQIDSPKMHEVVKECRGLILEKNTWKVLCRSFDRFYNFGEDGSRSFNFSNSICFEKLDGTLVNLYNDGRQWAYATRKMAYAEGPMHGKDENYADEIYNITPLTIGNMIKLDPENTYIFEYTSPENRVITKYDKAALTLLSIRNKSGYELPQKEVDEIAGHFDFNRPKQFYFSSYNDVMTHITNLPRLEEGYVCLNVSTGQRVKVKNPSYLAVAHLRVDGIASPKRIKSLIIEGGDYEYLADFPEDFPLFEADRMRYIHLLHEIILLQSGTRLIKDQKEYAMIVKDSPVSGIMFQLKKGRSLSAIIRGMTDAARIRLMGGKIERNNKIQ